MTDRYSIGQDCQLVLLWAGIRIDLRNVTGFQTQPSDSSQALGV